MNPHRVYTQIPLMTLFKYVYFNYCCACQKLNTELVLYIPETTKQFVVDKLKVKSSRTFSKMV